MDDWKIAIVPIVSVGVGRMDVLAQLVDRCEQVHISDGNDDIQSLILDVRDLQVDNFIPPLIGNF